MYVDEIQAITRSGEVFEDRDDAHSWIESWMVGRVEVWDLQVVWYRLVRLLLITRCLFIQMLKGDLMASMMYNFKREFCSNERVF